MSIDYQEFLRRKIKLESACGFDVDESEVNPVLKPHQRAMVRWALRGGRRALFASFGMGKTVCQLEICRLALAKLGSGRALIVAPLGVRQEFKRDAVERLGWQEPPRFVRRTEEVLTGQMFSEGHDIYLTNYESVRDGKLDVNLFDVVCLDEASCLRGFGGTKTFREFMGLFAGDKKTLNTRTQSAGIRYRFVATATPSPNDYIELLAYAAFLGVMDVSAGKAQPLDAKILTPTGWKMMGDINVGDEVIAGDGSSTKVLGVYPQGERPIYRVTFSDGGSTECDAEHLWLTTTRFDRETRRGLKPAKTRTTAEIAATIKVGGQVNHSVPLVGQVRFNAQQVSVDPWLLGVLLGDGSLRDLAGSITLTSADEWIVKEVARVLPENLRIKHSQRYAYSISNKIPKTGRGQRSNQLLNSLRSYGVLGQRAWEKRIPSDYLINSPEVRIGILRGLMDTDGSAPKTRRDSPRFRTASIGLAQDVQWLVRSLGGEARISMQHTTRRDSYCVTVRLPDGINPFSLPRKAELWKPSERLSRFIQSVEKTGVKPAQCIAVEHSERLYVTDDFAVTHNTRFFKRDSTKADRLTLHSHKEREFWLWVSSWALFLQSPADLGFDATGYDLPPLRVIKHEVRVDHSKALADRSGQHRLFREANHGVSEAAREKRDTLPERIEAMKAIIAASPNDHFLLWHDLEAERLAIEKAVPSSVSVYGSQDLDEREQAIIDFSDGKIQYLAAKPVIAGSGCNFQRHCHKAIFLGIGFKFNDCIQAIMRIQRFLQTEPCEIHLIYAESERSVLRTLERKWEQHNEMVKTMSEIIKKYGLSHEAMAQELTRGFGVERIEIRGENHTLINNDSVLETASMEENSVGLILTSIPFSTQYEYSPNYADFGHSDTNDHFFKQMDYLTPNLLRVLQPGRIAAIHVKDRIVPGGMTGLGFQVVYPFHARCIEHYTKHGFAYMGMKTIVTDVVRENNQTYRLGWTEQCKDGTKMGVGMPEYLLLFRKPPTDTSNSYADAPVVKHKEKYSRSRWQIDAHGFTRSSGERLLTPEELHKLQHHAIFKLFRKYSLSEVYDFEYHVALGEALELMGKLPVTFMLLQPQSWAPDVWTDITRMLTLNGAQSAKGKEMHLCLARGSLVLTRAGYKPIQDVEVGEDVLTHKGRWRPVIVKRCTGMRATVEVRAQGVPGLRLTPDHKLWVRKTDMARVREGAQKTEPKWIEAESTSGGYVNFKLPPAEPSSLTELEWWIVGRWLADGHQETRGNYIVSVGPDKLTAFLDKVGDHAGGQHSGTAVQVRLKGLSNALKETLQQCGRGATGKRLPGESFTISSEYAQALLAGYLSGDGHYIAERKRWHASSVSRELLLGLAALAQRAFRAVASIYPGRAPGQTVIEGRTVTTKQDWAFCFDVPSVADRNKPFILDDGAWKKVRSVESVGEVETWNLRVEEDESYTAEGCIVKNCPMQFDLADRVINQLSMPGETVLDPFGGLGTVAYRAIKLGRKGICIELSPSYFTDAAMYCEAAEREKLMPGLFDLLGETEQEAIRA